MHPLTGRWDMTDEDEVADDEGADECKLGKKPRCDSELRWSRRSGPKRQKGRVTVTQESENAEKH
jgi:hypothetical protein